MEGDIEDVVVNWFVLGINVEKQKINRAGAWWFSFN